jgi:hypothetical protein
VSGSISWRVEGANKSFAARLSLTQTTIQIGFGFAHVTIALGHAQGQNAFDTHATASSFANGSSDPKDHPDDERVAHEPTP